MAGLLHETAQNVLNTETSVGNTVSHASRYDFSVTKNEDIVNGLPSPPRSLPPAFQPEGKLE